MSIFFAWSIAVRGQSIKTRLIVLRREFFLNMSKYSTRCRSVMNSFLCETKKRPNTCFLFGACLLLFVICGCNSAQLAEDEDPKMIAAMQEARENIATFIGILESPTIDQNSFAIKVKVVDGDQVEHLWASDVLRTNDGFKARISDQPTLVTSIKKGETIEVDGEEISDWMYVDKGKLVGGYTIRVLRDMATQNERDEFDKSVPFRF